MTTPVPDAEDPGRYHPRSVIRKFLAAKAASTPAPELMGAAVHERWSVKTASDTDATDMIAQAPTATTIAELTALPVPAFLPPDGRSDGAEKTVWQLTATLREFGREADGDYHMVIVDANGKTMIAEIPNPGDITSLSNFAAQINSARSAFDAHFHLKDDIGAPSVQAAAAPARATAFHRAGVTVTLTGLGYFDFAHGQRGVAPNAIELHPVIGIAFDG